MGWRKGRGNEISKEMERDRQAVRYRQKQTQTGTERQSQGQGQPESQRGNSREKRPDKEMHSETEQHWNQIKKVLDSSTCSQGGKK